MKMTRKRPKQKTTSLTLLLDVGNTHTHVGFAEDSHISRQLDFPTQEWFTGMASTLLQDFLLSCSPDQLGVCSVVPKATTEIEHWCAKTLKLQPTVLSHNRIVGVGIDYPRPETIGPDRLANAVAVVQQYGAPALVVDFGTAVTFDVVNKEGNYVGGVIAPGLSAMTDYLHEKTALLPRISIQEPRNVIGKSTREAMLVGAVHGYRGLIREIIREIKQELGAPRLPVVATGGYARLIASKLDEIDSVNPLLTLQGLLLITQQSPASPCARPSKLTRSSIT